MTLSEIRQQAAISILNSLLETTKHSVVEAVALKDVYAHVAVMYADSLVDALGKQPDVVERFLEKVAWKNILQI